MPGRARRQNPGFISTPDVVASYLGVGSNYRAQIGYDAVLQHVKQYKVAWLFLAQSWWESNPT